MILSVRTHISNTCKELSIPESEFHSLDLHAWQAIQKKIETIFITEKHHSEAVTWYWNHFREPVFSKPFPPACYNTLPELVDPGEKVWFFVNDTVQEKTKFWFYEAKITAIKNVVLETIGLDEFYICSKKYEWLLCVNHHDILIATGQKLIDKLNHTLNK